MGKMKTLFIDSESALFAVWQEEWQELSLPQKAVIIADYSNMFIDEQWTSHEEAAQEYFARIYKGNLQSYAEVL